MKGAVVAGAILFGADPFAFHPISEAILCGLELWIIALFLRSSGEDILLGNLGLGMGNALAPLVPVHALLSAAISFLP